MIIKSIIFIARDCHRVKNIVHGIECVIFRLALLVKVTSSSSWPR